MTQLRVNIISQCYSFYSKLIFHMNAALVSIRDLMFFLQVNPQLYSTREKQQLHDLIDTMINYNLTYRQDRTPEGQYTYVLEP